MGLATWPHSGGLACWPSYCSTLGGSCTFATVEWDARLRCDLSCAALPRWQRQRRSCLPRQAFGSFALGVAVGALSLSAVQHLRRAAERNAASPKQDEHSEGSLGRALVQAAARGPGGLDLKARVAYDLVTAAAEAGVQEFSSSGDFAAVGRQAAEARGELIARAASELGSGHADVQTVAEFLVDAALARAARCAQGAGGIYSELWTLDEGRAAVASVYASRAEVPLDGEGAVARMLAAKDILIDEHPRLGESSALARPLFVKVQPHVFTRTTHLALLQVFEVFHGRAQYVSEYSSTEKLKIQRLLDATDRTPVMRRARAEVAKMQGEPMDDEVWRRLMWHVWFERHPGSKKCGFEHVFVGEASEDEHGRGIVGGLHNWFKFYLEEQRGAATYLGPRYKGRTTLEDAALNPYFVSGRFTWNLEGQHLVKDVGGFFVGVSPEWQIAVATTAFFETENLERAAARQWSRDFLSRDIGFVRAARLGEHVYRLVVRRNDAGNLTTFFAAQLGTWDARARAQLDEELPASELQARLPGLLVLHGFADEPELLCCASRIAAAGCFSLRDALRHLRKELSYSLEEAVVAASGGQSQELSDLMAGDFRLVVPEVILAYEEGRLRSSHWVELLDHISARCGMEGRQLLQPLRLALTGRLRGHGLRDLLCLLELLEHGAPWSAELLPLSGRISALRQWSAMASNVAECCMEL